MRKVPHWCTDGTLGAGAVPWLSMGWNEALRKQARRSLTPCSGSGRVLGQRVPQGCWATSLEMLCLEMLELSQAHPEDAAPCTDTPAASRRQP